MSFPRKRESSSEVLGSGLSPEHHTVQGKPGMTIKVKELLIHYAKPPNTVVPPYNSIKIRRANNLSALMTQIWSGTNKCDPTALTPKGDIICCFQRKT